MTAKVAARLALGGSFTTRSFELRDLAATVHAFGPESLALGFMLCENGRSTLQFACEFDNLGGRNGRADERARLLKENLLRADIAGRFDCLFVDDTAGLAAMQSLSLAPPDDASLPSGQWLALPAPLLDAAVDVLQHAQANGLAVGYRVGLKTRAADAALARRLVPALAAITTQGRHPKIEQALHETIRLVSGDGWSAHETFLLPADGAGGAWLDKLVLRRLKSGAPFLPTDFWAVGRNAQPSATPAGTIQRARGADYPDLVLDAIAPSRDQSAVATPQRHALPAQSGDYVFISYSHADRGYGQQVIDRLHEAGARVWYDAGIRAGTVWDKELESRIRGAGAVVVCLTAQYEQSRYCTRELKFADLLSKSILPIAPTPWVWGSGLQLMFQELQVCSFDQGRGFGAFRDALRAAAPKVFHAI